MKTSYYTLMGTIMGERSIAAGRVNFAPDALGSVTAVLSSAGVQSQYRYTPYGALENSLGTGPMPRFLWGGTRGYRTTKLGMATHYVRARHYSATLGVWTTVDPLWPKEPAYTYAGGSPTNRLDPTGLTLQHKYLGCGCTQVPVLQPDSEHVPYLSQKQKRRLRPYRRLLFHACESYSPKCDELEKLAGSYCGTYAAAYNVIDPEEGLLPKCTPRNPFWKDCACDGQFVGWANESNCGDDGQYNPHTGRHGSWVYFACRVECTIRVCCWAVPPRRHALNYDLFMAFKAARKRYPTLASEYELLLSE